MNQNGQQSKQNLGLGIFLIMSVVSLVGTYYGYLWESTSAFVVAIDHHEQLFQDFVGYYYPMAANIMGSTEPIIGYYYSSFFALLLWPLTIAPLEAAMWIWGIVQIFGAAMLFVLPLKLLLPRKTGWLIGYTALYTTSFPLLHNFKWGQVSILLTACIIGAYYCFQTGKQHMLVGGLLAVAAAIKYYPALFLIYFVLKREHRVVVSFIVVIVTIFVLVPAIILGPREWFTFEFLKQGAGFDAARISNDVNSQFFAHVVIRWARTLVDFTASGSVDVVKQTLQLVGYGIVLCNISLVGWLVKNNKQEQIEYSQIILFLSIPFLLGTSWPHYFVFLPFAQLVVAHRLFSGDFRGLIRLRIATALVLVSMGCSSVLVFNLFTSWRQYSAAGMLLLSNLSLLFAVYLTVMQSRRAAQATSTHQSIPHKSIVLLLSQETRS